MNTLVDRTHDISRIDYHVKDLATFGETLTSAVAAAFPNEIAFRSQAGHGDERPRYQEIHVLLISWEDDNLGVVKEISELREVFQKTYCYGTKEFQIPSHKSHNALARRLLEFVDEPESKESLLIVYYGGHGYMNDDRQCIWSCAGKADSPTVQWFGLQTMLEQAQSDVLILLDCCAAASSTAGSGTGVTELIAACGFETWAPGVSEHSFTRSLIDELIFWAHGPTLTVALLHNKVLSRIKYWKPRYGSTGNYEHRKTPIYIVLANDGKQRSIELEPLRHQASSELEAPVPPSGGPLSQWPPHSSAPSTEPSTDADDNPSSSSQSSLSHVWPDPQYKCPKVLVSLALEDDQILETKAWVDWLRSVPAVVQYAHVQGLYRSDSTLLLLSLPVSIWDLLPKDPAIIFIGFVRSPDLLKAHNDLESSSTSNSSNIQSQQKRIACHHCQTLSVENATKCGNCGHLHCVQCLLEVLNPDSLAVFPTTTNNKSLQRKVSLEDTVWYSKDRLLLREDIITIGRSFASGSLGIINQSDGSSMPVLVEWMMQIPLAIHNRGEGTLYDRLEAIAKNYRDPEVFRGLPVLRCLGHFYDTHHSSPGLIYQIPTTQSVPPHPFTLKEAICTYDRPNVDELYSCAYRISNALLQLHRRRWHLRNFSSDTVVLSDLHVKPGGWDGGPRSKESRSRNPKSNTRVYEQHHGEPAISSRALYIVGIQHTHSDDWMFPGFEHVPPEVLRRMIHVHPDCKNYGYTYSNSPVFNYYGLGMVLIELGLWMQLDHVAEEQAFAFTPAAAPHLWLREYVPKLGPSMGSTYEDIVAWCLGAANNAGFMNVFDRVDDFEENVVDRIKDFLL